jgi:hypothetical protein
MSRAFVNEDAAQDPGPDYRLPDPNSSFFDEAAAWALIQGANLGDTKSAEVATGYRWGEPHLVRHIRGILAQAETDGSDRIAQLARRYLTAAGR